MNLMQSEHNSSEENSSHSSSFVKFPVAVSAILIFPIQKSNLMRCYFVDLMLLYVVKSEIFVWDIFIVLIKIFVLGGICGKHLKTTF